MKTEVVRVDLAGRSYDITIGQGLIARAGELVAPHLKRKFVAIVTDENVAKIHLPALQHSLNSAGIGNSTIIIPPGEASKSYAMFEKVCDGIIAAKLERRDLMRVVCRQANGVSRDLRNLAHQDSTMARAAAADHRLMIGTA